MSDDITASPGAVNGTSQKFLLQAKVHGDRRLSEADLRVAYFIIDWYGIEGRPTDFYRPDIGKELSSTDANISRYHPRRLIPHLLSALYRPSLDLVEKEVVAVFLEGVNAVLQDRVPAAGDQQQGDHDGRSDDGVIRAEGLFARFGELAIGCRQRRHRRWAVGAVRRRGRGRVGRDDLAGHRGKGYRGHTHRSRLLVHRAAAIQGRGKFASAS